jgi:hypothetical protein
VVEPASEAAFAGDDGTLVAGDDSGGALHHGEVTRRVRHHRTREGGGLGRISPAMAASKPVTPAVVWTQGKGSGGGRRRCIFSLGRSRVGEGNGKGAHRRALRLKKERRYGR